jgi:ABC-type transport system substrate-binding protein
MAALLVVGGVVAAGCAGDDDDDSGGDSSTPAVTEGPTTGDTGGSDTTAGGGAVDDTPLVIARNMDLTSGDPSRAVCDTCQFVFNSLYQTLVGLDTDNKTLTPLIAKTWG